MVSRWKLYFFQFIDLCRELGLAGALRDIAYARRTALLVRKDLADFHLSEAGSAGAPMAIREISRENIQDLNLVSRSKATLAKLRRNAAAGYECLVAELQGEVVGYSWFVVPERGRSPSVHPDVRWLQLSLAPDEVYLFDIRILPEKRGAKRGLHLLGATLEALKARGFRRAYGYVLADNAPQRRNLLKLGFEEVKVLETRRFLWVRRACAASPRGAARRFSQISSHRHIFVI